MASYTQRSAVWFYDRVERKAAISCGFWADTFNALTHYGLLHAVISCVVLWSQIGISTILRLRGFQLSMLKHWRRRRGLWIKNMTYRDTALPMMNVNSSPIANAVGSSAVIISVFMLGSVQRQSRISNFFQNDAYTHTVYTNINIQIYKYTKKKSHVYVSTDNIVYL